MANKPNAIPFNFGQAEVVEATLIPVGSYNGTIEQSKFVDMPDGTTRLWLGIRISGPKQAGRFITTLCPTSDVAKSAYKTKALITSVASHLGGVFLPADAELLHGATLSIDVIQWTPRNTGETVNDIRTFRATKVDLTKKPKDVTELVEGLANELQF
jgi:hypothetical protein